MSTTGFLADLNTEQAEPEHGIDAIAIHAKGSTPVLAKKLLAIGKSALDGEIASLVGYEISASQRDFRQALHRLDAQMNLGLDDTDSKLIGLLFDYLKDAKRFIGSQDVKEGENSATHTLFCLPLIQRDVIAAGAAHTLEAQELIKLTARQLLIHDCGEVIGEFTTVNKMHNLANQDEKSVINRAKDELEQRFLEKMMIYALDAIDNDTIDAFHRKVRTLRDEADITNRGILVPINPDAPDQDKRYAFSYENYQRLFELSGIDNSPTLSPAMQAKFDEWMGYFHSVETQEAQPVLTEAGYGEQMQRFCAFWAKSVEQTQGGRHVVRHGLRNASFMETPVKGGLDERDNQYVLANLKRSEMYLPDLFAATGQKEGSIMLAIARHHAAAAYHTVSELLKYFSPVQRGEAMLTDIDPQPSEFSSALDAMRLRQRGIDRDIYDNAARAVINGEHVPQWSYKTEDGSYKRTPKKEEGQFAEILAQTRPDNLTPAQSWVSRHESSASTPAMRA